MRILAGLLLLGAMLLVGTPYLIKYMLKEWLLAHGGERVSIAEVDFNPFIGRLRLANLQLQAQGQHSLTCTEALLDLAWLPLLQRHIDVQSLVLRGLRMEVDNRDDLLLLLGGIRVEKKAEKAAGEEARPPGPSWAGSVRQLLLEDSRLDYRGRELTLHAAIDHLQLQHLTQWMPERPSTLEIQGTLNDAPLRLQARLKPFAEVPAYAGHLDMEAFGLEALAAHVRDTFPTFSGRLTLGVDFNVQQPEDGLQLTPKGRIRLDSLRLATKDWGLEEKSLQWKGELHLDTAGGVPHLSGQGRATVRGLDFTTRADMARLGGFERLELDGLKLQQSGELAIDRILAQALRLGQPAAGDVPPLIQAGLLRIEDIRYAHNTLRIARIEGQDLASTFVRDPKGVIDIARLVDMTASLGNPPHSSPAQAAPEQGDDSSPRVVIDRITATGDSHLRFIDQSVNPAFTLDLKLEKADFASIDTARPRQASRLDIRGRIGKYTTVTATGAISPLLAPPRMDIAVQLKAMDLYPLTPYTRDSLGLTITSGSMDMDMRLLSREQRLDGKIVLLLHQFEVGSVDVKNSIQRQIPLPLNVALDALRDRNNVIRLKIPVTGNPTSPEFSFSDALRQALVKGLSKGALAYLSYALQPYGTLVAVARYAGEEVTRVRLKAVEFAPGDSMLNEEGKDYLAKVAGILSDRPKLSIKLCGVATARDLTVRDGEDRDSPPPTEEEQAVLRKLAARRANAVKSYLVESLHADASRLAGCQPRLELNAKAVPRTDLLI